MKRSSGILLHITSLASPYGIGTLGEAALRFVDFLADSDVGWWQVLPVNPIGAGNSPYYSPGVFAGEPLLIDLDELVADGMLQKAECDEIDWGSDESAVDYPKVKAGRERLLRLAYSRTDESFRTSVAQFCENRPKLINYTRYKALCETMQTVSLPKPDDLPKEDIPGNQNFYREVTAEEGYQKFLQYLFFWQFGRLRAYAAGRGVGLIGDLPIYISPESADLWYDAHLFQTDDTRQLKRVAGVPPDAFSQNGQLWGNPLYDWDAMRADGYRWWILRMRFAAELFDMVRLDHFRAFDQYWAVEYGSQTAQNGRWHAGPGMALFDALKKELMHYPVIAEDLGTITDSVRILRRQTGFLGMRVMQFGFVDETDNEHLPHRHTEDLAVYTATHDNETLQSFIQKLPPNLRRHCRDYFGTEKGRESEALLRAAFSSVACLCIVPMQDLPGVVPVRRMNTPGTVDDANWSWRLSKNQPGDQTRQILMAYNKLYGRN